MALAKKNAGLAQFTENVVLSEEIQELLQKVKISEDEELTKLLPDIRGAVVEVSAAGQCYRCRIDYSLGEPENPMDEVAIVNKFIELAEYAGVSSQKAKSIVEKVNNGQIIINY